MRVAFPVINQRPTLGDLLHDLHRDDPRARRLGRCRHRRHLKRVQRNPRVPVAHGDQMGARLLVHLDPQGGHSPLAVGKRPADDGPDLLVAQRFQAQDPGA